MNTQIKVVDHAICEINQIKKGEITYANRMLMERIEIMDRMWALDCLIDGGGDISITSYINEQIKEMATKLITI